MTWSNRRMLFAASRVGFLIVALNCVSMVLASSTNKGATSRGTVQSTPSQVLRVRSRRIQTSQNEYTNEDDVEQLSMNRRDQSIFEKITFSDEGEPLDIPEFQLQLFPTPESISEESGLLLELALQDYLLATFSSKYPELEDEEDETATAPETEGPPQLVSVTVALKALRGVVSNDTRGRQRMLQSRQGTEVDVEATLNFKEAIFPPTDDVESEMNNALFNNFDTFVTDYLQGYATDELAGVESGVYVSGFTDRPTAAPSMPPVEPPSGTSISAINSGTPVNVQSENRLRTLVPALICGIAMFLLTTLFLAHRRRQLKSFNLDGADEDEFDDEEDFSVDHISIDYDGREEARQLELEQKQADQAKEAEQLDELRMIGGQKATQGTICSVFMGRGNNQGNTAIHVPPVMEARSSSRHWEPSAMVVGKASSSVGSSYYDDQEMNSASGSEWSTNNNVNAYGGERKLPSMRGGSEFGMGGVINRGLI